MLNIQYLRELCEKATKGPWWKGSHVRYAINSIDRHVAMVNCMVHTSGDIAESWANADFIAAAREALPELLDRVEKLEKVAEAGQRVVLDRTQFCDWDFDELDRALRDAGMEVRHA